MGTKQIEITGCKIMAVLKVVPELTAKAPLPLASQVVRLEPNDFQLLGPFTEHLAGKWLATYAATKQATHVSRLYQRQNRPG